MHNFDEEFRDITSGIDAQEWPTETIDKTPYGPPTCPVKPGLTKRGKAALAIGGAILAGSALMGYQAYSSSAADSNAKAQEIALQQQKIELEKLKEANRSNVNQAGNNDTRQAHIDKCVKDNKDLIGKGYNSSYRDIVDACQAQYTPTNGGDDMQSTASTEDTSSSHGGGINDGFLIGGAALGLFVIAAVRKSPRSNQT